MRLALSPFVLGLFLCLGPQGALASAKTTILAVDPFPLQETVGEGERLSDLLGGILINDAPETAVVLSRPLIVLADLDPLGARERILAALPAERLSSGLDARLAEAAELFPTDTENELILVTVGSSDSGQSLLQALDQLSRRGIRIRIHYLSPDAEAPCAGGGEDVRIVGVPCAYGDTLIKVRQAVARAIGMSESDIGPESRFEDFGLDATRTWEVVEAVCAEFNALPPRDLPPATVAALADYLDRQSPVPGSRAQAQVDAPPSFAATSGGEKKAFFEQVVFYGTNRARTGSNEPSSFYGGQRAAYPHLSYGQCLVTIPAVHQRGAVESPFLGLKFLEDENRHMLLTRVTPMGRDEFFNLVKSKVHLGAVKEGWENDVVIFIHGFNVSFDEAARRTAQMAYDFGFKGAPIMFSWPSDAQIYAYMSDREDIQWSVSHIEEFLQEVTERILPRRVHLVAHSMGNQGLIGALNLLALRRGAEGRHLFENVILAAPDFDAQLFQEQIAPRVRFLARHWTVYTSDRDAALNFSTRINSARRLGLPVTPVGGIDVVDATGVEVTPWSVPEFHSYYATKQKVIHDIVQTIKGVAPGLRGLSARKTGNLPFWQLVAE